MTTAYMLAAGAGSRLDPAHDAPPKVLLRFGGRSLLHRHVALLRACGVRELVMVVGYRSELIAREVQALGAEGFVRLVANPDYRAGAMGSLWRLSREFSGTGPSLLMDADVLYDQRLLARLMQCDQVNCLLVDRKVGEGDDPLRVCLQGDRIVDFHKRPSATHDRQAQWIGFIRYSSAMARLQHDYVRPYIEADRLDAIYEEPMRDLLVAAPEPFHCVDVSDLPWIEIDFPADLARAEREVFPDLEALPQ